MTVRPQTFVEHYILQQDAARNLHYRSFEDFWQLRMAPMQFIPAAATGALGALLAVNKERAREQWILYQTTVLTAGAAHRCGGSPQAGELPASRSPDPEPLLEQFYG